MRYQDGPIRSSSPSTNTRNQQDLLPKCSNSLPGRSRTNSCCTLTWFRILIKSRGDHRSRFGLWFCWSYVQQKKRRRKKGKPYDEECTKEWKIWWGRKCKPVPNLEIRRLSDTSGPESWWAHTGPTALIEQLLWRAVPRSNSAHSLLNSSSSDIPPPRALDPFAWPGDPPKWLPSTTEGLWPNVGWRLGTWAKGTELSKGFIVTRLDLTSPVLVGPPKICRSAAWWLCSGPVDAKSASDAGGAVVAGGLSFSVPPAANIAARCAFIAIIAYHNTSCIESIWFHQYALPS